MQAAGGEHGGIGRFLDALALDGFSIGVRESLKAHQLAGLLAQRSMALEGNGQARAMFTALVARDPAEQRRAGELYDRALSGETDAPPPPPPERKPVTVPPRDPRTLGYVLAGLAAVALVAVFVFMRTPEPIPAPPPPPPDKIEPGPRPDPVPVETKPVQGAWTPDDLYADLDRLMRENRISAAPTLRELQKAGWPPKDATGGVKLPLTALVQRLQLAPDWPVDLNADAVRRKVATAFTDYGVSGPMPLHAFAAPDLAELHRIISGFGFGDAAARAMYDALIGGSQAERVATAGVDNSVSPDLVDRALAIYLPVVTDEAMPFAGASWKPPVPSAVMTAPTWLRPAATAAPFLVLALWFLRLASRRRATITRRAEAGSPLDHRFVLGAQGKVAAQFTDKPYLMRIAASLNVRQTVAALSIDPDRSIRASIASGGLFTPVRGRITTTPAYLLLIEAKSAYDQEARRLELLHRRIADAGVTVKRFFYFDSPAWLHEEFDAEPVPVEDVAARYEDRRLIVLGEGRGFFAPPALKPEPWAQVLAVWPQRAMLTPRPLAEWGAQEFAIARELGLPLGRATLEGLFALAELLGLDEGRDRPSFRAYGFAGGFDLKPLPALIRARPFFWLSESDPGEADTARLDRVLGYYLDVQGLEWLKALAVYPALQWDLTLYLGRELGLYGEPRLAALTLLPWLREGHMPQWLRRRLAAALPDDIRVRTIAAIHAIMAEGRETGTPKVKLARRDPMRRPTLMGEQPSRDGLFVEALVKEGDFPAPDWLMPSLKSWFATLAWKDFGVAAAACAYAAAAWWLAPSPAGGALGPGAYMPLTALAVLPLPGWLTLAWFEDRLHVPEWLAAWWQRRVEEEAARESAVRAWASGDTWFASLGRRLGDWWRGLTRGPATKTGEPAPMAAPLPEDEPAAAPMRQSARQASRDKEAAK